MNEPTQDQASADQAKADADLAAAQQEETVAADEQAVVDAQDQLNLDAGQGIVNAVQGGNDTPDPNSAPAPTVDTSGQDTQKTLEAGEGITNAIQGGNDDAAATETTD